MAKADKKLGRSMRRNKESMKKLAISAAAGLTGFAALLAGSAHAASETVEAAKAACVVGERNDGYLGVIDEAQADDALRREISAINLQRKAAYERLATRNGVTIDAAATLTAERLINGAGSGECVQDASGNWVRIP